MFRLHRLGWRLRRPFLALCQRIRRAKISLFLAAFAVLILNHAAKSGFLRLPSTMVRNDQCRKGKLMQTRTTNHAIDAESIWGLEVMDPLEQRVWAQSLWQRLSSPGPASRSLLLLYSPAAERAALRALTALAIISREESFAVHRFAPGFLPVLPAVRLTAPATLLIHHSNRFVNLDEWLMQIASPSPACRVILTAPAAEFELIAGSAKFDSVLVPEEDPDYCEHRANEILDKFFRSAASASPELERIEPILIEAGMAEVRLPLTLLARHVRSQNGALIEKLQGSRLRKFIWWPEASAETSRTVAFRGRWLAERMAATPARPFPRLIALLQEANSALPGERYFFLNLLMALRSRGDLTTVEQLLRDYYDLFHKAALLSGPQERQAWGRFHPLSLQSVFHL
jgi:hypothetical protein